ncbi:hypothetical protein GCK72_023971 [Caenorhabditis remanei]|uniref:Exonuclease domain-containing protein n=1 Tax=Caenorhabditis remanei TaxID=31234 RepID=A0A6A5FY16_CAERE|nr:hypothetical protein GCK72_023971 [Caenorhabditis remanei]KAF1747506.1 hypothetical protein GCK72_023971 [Caenorhabditis remanei]
MSSRQCPYDNLLMLDFETTSDGVYHDYPFEVIQFSVAVLDVKSNTISDDVSFNEYVRPVINPKLSSYCADLTGIKQETLDKADTFLNVYKKFLSWLDQNNFEEKKFALVSDSRQDMWRIAQYQFRLCREPLPSMFRQYINLWRTFGENMTMEERDKLEGNTYMEKMAIFHGVKSPGRAHNAMIDCLTLARITQKIFEGGASVYINEALVCSAPWRKKPLELEKGKDWRTDFHSATKVFERVMPLVVKVCRRGEYNLSMYNFCWYCKAEHKKCESKPKQKPVAFYAEQEKPIAYALAAGYC